MTGAALCIFVLHQFVMGDTSPMLATLGYSGLGEVQCQNGRCSSDRTEVKVRAVCFPDTGIGSRYTLSGPISIS